MFPFSLLPFSTLIYSFYPLKPQHSSPKTHHKKHSTLISIKNHKIMWKCLLFSRFAQPQSSHTQKRDLSPHDISVETKKIIRFFASCQKILHAPFSFHSWKIIMLIKKTLNGWTMNRTKKTVSLLICSPDFISRIPQKMDALRYIKTWDA